MPSKNNTKLTKKEIENCKSLDRWLEKVPITEIDAMLEWLRDSDYLNEKGKEFEHQYWYYCWWLKRKDIKKKRKIKLKSTAQNER